MVSSLPSINNGLGLNGPHYMQTGSHICPMVSTMGVVEQTGIQMRKEYFEIEASESTP